MSTLIMKFGGVSLRDPQSFYNVADIICNKVDHYKHILVVVSAMEKMTDRLIALAKQISTHPPKRERDMLISVGERISMALLAMALKERGLSALSLTGSQSGIITSKQHLEAKIIDVRPRRILTHFQEGQIIIVAGFQGVSEEKEITTLGRGGSDTSAVALGIALKAERVEFYKDVPGVYSEDPQKNPKSTFFPKLGFRQAMALARKGPFVLHPRAVALASKNQLPLCILSFRQECRSRYPGTQIGKRGGERVSHPIYELA